MYIITKGEEILHLSTVVPENDGEWFRIITPQWIIVPLVETEGITTHEVPFESIPEDFTPELYRFENLQFISSQNIEWKSKTWKQYLLKQVTDEWSDELQTMEQLPTEQLNADTQ